MPLKSHPSFDRPSISIQLWRYTDLSKFFDLLISQSLWLTNLEYLASDDPYEGLPDAVQFPHRLWKTIADVPEEMRTKIIQSHGDGDENKSDEAFLEWFIIQEQVCLFTFYGRRNYFVNCWHASNHESAAMWKIYGSPGSGVAVVTNGARLEEALAKNSEVLHLGKVQYQEPGTIVFGTKNSFDKTLFKRAHYAYEQEVRLVYWDTSDLHDPLSKFSWNSEKMRFDSIVEDNREVRPGHRLVVDVDTLIERVIISPTAPSWYGPMINQLAEKLNYKFRIEQSSLLQPPSAIS